MRSLDSLLSNKSQSKKTGGETVIRVKILGFIYFTYI